MRELFLKKSDVDGENLLTVIDPNDDSLLYVLTKRKESMTSEDYVVQTRTGGQAASVRVEHIMFTPARLPRVTVSMKNGGSFTLKKELEQLSDILCVEGEQLAIGGSPFSKHYELLRAGEVIADVTYKKPGKLIRIGSGADELTAILLALGIELAR